MIQRFKPHRVRSYKAADITKPFRTYGRLHQVLRGWSTV